MKTTLKHLFSINKPLGCFLHFLLSIFRIFVSVNDRDVVETYYLTLGLPFMIITKS